MSAAMYLGLVMVAVSIIAALCFVSYLLFLRFVIDKTGTTEGLKDVAKAMHAYRVPLVNRSSRRPPG